VNDPRTEIFQLALHASPSGILVVGGQGEIVFANQTLADMFGYSTEELLGREVEILLPEQLVGMHQHHVAHFMRQPFARSMGGGKDFDGVTRDGRRFPVEIGLRPANTEMGRMVVATVIDISKRKAIEERLRKHEEQLEELVEERTRELHEAQREKERVLEHLIQAEKMTTVGTLVSGIGHEINNPLYAAQATAEALTQEQDLAQCHAYGQEILRQVQSIAETVRNLSRYAQPGARLDLQPIDINASVAGAVRLARRSFDSDRIEIKTFTNPVPAIMAKPDEIQQVLFNIIRNGIQAMGDKGTIEIRTGREANWVTVRIRDTGAGIAEEYLKQVFDPFFTTKGPDEGEGLGLYIVRQIIAQCDGMIDAANAAEGGAVFAIRLPVVDRQNVKGK
jgi:PAS domain S-box-containing protein